MKLAQGQAVPSVLAHQSPRLRIRKSVLGYTALAE